MRTQNLLCFQTQPSSRKQSGLTMIELLVTLAIAAILLSIGVPSFARMTADWRLKNAINSFNGSLRVARTEAIARRKVVKLCAINPAASKDIECATQKPDYSNGWIVYVGNNVKDSSTLIVQKPLSGLKAIENTTGITIQFLPTGIGRGFPGSLTFKTNSCGETEASCPDWAKKKVTIDKAGRITNS